MKAIDKAFIALMERGREREETRKYATATRGLLMPRAYRFSQLFDPPAPSKKIVATFTAKGSLTRGGRRKSESMKVSNWINVSGAGAGIHGSFYANPKSALIERLKATHLVVDHDELYFEIVIRDKASALVLSKHNQILGSRQIAVIDPSTIPLVI